MPQILHSYFETLQPFPQISNLYYKIDVPYLIIQCLPGIIYFRSTHTIFTVLYNSDFFIHTHFIFIGCAGSLSPVVMSDECCDSCGLLSRCSVPASHCGGVSCCPRARGPFRGCGKRAQLFYGIWDLPRPGIKPTSPSLVGGFFTTEPPGRPKIYF